MGEERGPCGMTNMKMENREKRAQMNTWVGNNTKMIFISRTKSH
jgi:hypothetical protein